MFVTKVLTKDYENVHLRTSPKTNPIKPNTNPIQTQFKANLQNGENPRKLFFNKQLQRKSPRLAPQKQTQNKPNSNSKQSRIKSRDAVLIV